MLSRPETLLSQRAIDRRRRQHISIDETDLPVSSAYLKELVDAGYSIISTSRWMNSVVVATSDSLASASLMNFPFVTDAQLVWIDNQVQKSFFVKMDELGGRKKSRSSSEDALLQLQIHHGDQLHQAGYRGENMWIAVIDAGFLNVDKIPQLYGRVLGTHDFVDPSGDIFSTHPHGTNVLSIMASPASETFSGTAPNAQYWLLRSEDSSSEYPVEEDYWVAAAEYADSLGVDVINSSLGYSLFDDPSMNHTHEQLDGKTAQITRGAGIAASKGILVVNSAGNERQNPWHRINFPADHHSILTVGAVTPDLTPAWFSGVGLQNNGSVKPMLLHLATRPM
jgi:Subtilisin-like serine proteases